jgi:hypothetical protein
METVMADQRTIEQVRSHSADFESGEWIVRPVGPGYRVGAGIYLMVPVDPMKAQRIRHAIERVLDEYSDVSAEAPHK